MHQPGVMIHTHMQCSFFCVKGILPDITGLNQPSSLSVSSSFIPPPSLPLSFPPSYPPSLSPSFPPFQFTLCHVLKGNKPDFHIAMEGTAANVMYNDFLKSLGSLLRRPEDAKGNGQDCRGH